MTITFQEAQSKTAWVLSVEEERLLEALRMRLLEQVPPRPQPGEPHREPLPRFATIADMIHTHIADSLLLDQIRLETEQSYRAAAIAEVESKRRALDPARVPV